MVHSLTCALVHQHSYAPNQQMCSECLGSSPTTPTPTTVGVLQSCFITVQCHESHELDCKALSNHQLLLVAYLYSIRFCHYVRQHQHLALLLQSSGQ